MRTVLHRRRGIVWTVGLAALALAGVIGASVIHERASSEAASNLADPLKGWSLNLQSGDARVRVLQPAAAFVLAPGESLHPFIPASDLRANYASQIAIPDAGAYRFGVHVRGGSCEVRVIDAKGKKVGEAIVTAPADGQSDARGASDWIDLPAGKAVLSLTFTRAGDAPARLRTMWERRGAGDVAFPPEAIPAWSVTPPASTLADLEKSELAFRGRVLMGELGCAHCHDSPGAAPPANHGDAGHDHASHASDPMLLTRPAPILGDIGQRASPSWLAKWVREPQALKPGVGMPDVFPDTPKDDAVAEAIVHFLVSMGGPMSAAPVATEKPVLDEGRRLFHSVGCVMCHGPLEPASKVFGDPALAAKLPESAPPQPYGRLAGKWNARELSAFLLDPAKIRPAGRMPSMSLTESESDAIANYLITQWNASDGEGNTPAPAEPAFTVDPQKVMMGRVAFGTRGCANCHDLGPTRDPVPGRKKAKPLAGLKGDAGCLNAGDAATPRYSLSDGDRKALAAALASGIATAKGGARAPLDATHRTIEALHCRVCHERDGRGGPPDDLRAFFRSDEDAEPSDEGRLPPHITGVGTKLTTPWLREVLEQGGRARPYMHTRMPQFGAAAIAGLSESLASCDGVLANSDADEPVASDNVRSMGRLLVGDTGMNCISCHTFGDEMPAGTRGPDMTKFAERLRFEWYRPYLLNPSRFKPGTRMTDFFARSDGLGIVQGVLDDKAETHVDAVWAYLNTGLFIPIPSGVPSGSGLPLRVEGKPIVFRGFLKDGGSRGIAVGFPEGLHFAFDATNVRLVDAWQGAFLDASGAWASRGGNVAGGQGKVAWSAAKAMPIVFADKPEPWPTELGRDAGYQFRGYTLDAKGVPTFEYEVHGNDGAHIRVRERIEPREGGRTFERAFTIQGLPVGKQLWINPGKGAGEGQVTGATASSQSFGDVTITGVRAADSSQIVVMFEVKP